MRIRNLRFYEVPSFRLGTGQSLIGSLCGRFWANLIEKLAFKKWKNAFTLGRFFDIIELEKCWIFVLPKLKIG